MNQNNTKRQVLNFIYEVSCMYNDQTLKNMFNGCVDKNNIEQCLSYIKGKYNMEFLENT